MAEPKSKKEQLLNRTLLQQGTYTNDPIDLNNCEKEPIHIPGFIQPHGVLLAINTSHVPTIVQCSQNTVDHLGIACDDILGMPLQDLIGEQYVRQLLSSSFNADVTSDLHYMNLTIAVAGEDRVFSAVLHESEGLLILEIEPFYEKRTWKRLTLNGYPVSSAGSKAQTVAWKQARLRLNR